MMKKLDLPCRRILASRLPLGTYPKAIRTDGDGRTHTHTNANSIPEHICNSKPQTRRKSCQTAVKVRQRRRKMLGEAAQDCKAVLPEHAGYPEQQSQQELSRGIEVHGSTKSIPGRSVGGEPTKDGADGETAQVRHQQDAVHCQGQVREREGTGNATS